MTRSAALGLFSLFVMIFGCNPPGGGSGTSAAPAGSGAARAAAVGDPVRLTVAYGSEKKTWLEEQAAAFKASGAKTKSGRPVAVELKAMGSGEAVQGIVAGTLKPHVFSPASALYLTQLNGAWAAKAGRAKLLSPAGEPLVLSPIVVAMWKPMAEALGWPGKPVGWAELLKVAANPKGWGALGHPEWGRFKLGHTHPEYSSSGLQAIVAEAYAGAKKVRGLGLADLDKKEVVEKLTDIEQTIVHYGKSTGFFADKMLSRGPSYLSGAVLYENLVIESYGKDTGAPFPVVAVYPTEGTFWSDHPYAVLDAEWVGAEERDAAAAFLAFLKARPAQERALALGFRPADASIAIGAPVDAAHGVDPKQPQTLLEVPDGPTLEKLVGVWQTAKKSSDVIVVFDISGSMRGKPLAEAKSGAKAFLSTLHARDDATLIFFNGNVFSPFGPKKVGTSRAELDAKIDGQIADGKTALYDAVAKALELAQGRAEKAPGIIHAVVVMTDGRDEGSTLALPGLTSRLGGSTEAASDVKVFTIAYGEGADPTVLATIAEAAKGTSSKGDTATIADVFRDLAAFF